MRRELSVISADREQIDAKIAELKPQGDNADPKEVDALEAEVSSLQGRLGRLERTLAATRLRMTLRYGIILLPVWATFGLLLTLGQHEGERSIDQLKRNLAHDCQGCRTFTVGQRSTIGIAALQSDNMLIVAHIGGVTLFPMEQEMVVSTYKRAGKSPGQTTGSLPTNRVNPP